MTYFEPRILRYARRKTGVLSGNAAHQFALAHAMCIYRPAAIYSFIPKNACSTVRLSLAIANGCIEEASEINWIHQNNATFAADLEALICAHYTFVILRDPFARLASCFLDKIVAKDVQAWKLHDQIERRLHPNDITFADFVESMRIRSVRTSDIHWRPQADFLVYDRYDDYFAVEQFAAATAAIRDRAGIDVVDARPLTKHGLDRYRVLSPEQDHSRTPAIEIAWLQRHGESPHPRSLYTPELVTIVADVYAADVALYADKIGSSMIFPLP